LRVALVSSGLVPVPPTRGSAVEECVYKLSRYLRRLGADAAVMDAKHDSDSLFTRRSMKHRSLKFQQPNHVQTSTREFFRDFYSEEWLRSTSIGKVLTLFMLILLGPTSP